MYLIFKHVDNYKLGEHHVFMVIQSISVLKKLGASVQFIHSKGGWQLEWDSLVVFIDKQMVI